MYEDDLWQLWCPDVGSRSHNTGSTLWHHLMCVKQSEGTSGMHKPNDFVLEGPKSTVPQVTLFAQDASLDSGSCLASSQAEPLGERDIGG